MITTFFLSPSESGLTRVKVKSKAQEQQEIHWSSHLTTSGLTKETERHPEPRFPLPWALPMLRSKNSGPYFAEEDTSARSSQTSLQIHRTQRQHGVGGGCPGFAVKQIQVLRPAHATVWQGTGYTLSSDFTCKLREWWKSSLLGLLGDQTLC